MFEINADLPGSNAIRKYSQKVSASTVAFRETFSSAQRYVYYSDHRLPPPSSSSYVTNTIVSSRPDVRQTITLANHSDRARQSAPKEEEDEAGRRNGRRNEREGERGGGKGQNNSLADNMVHLSKRI